MSTTIHTYSATSLDWETAFSQDPSAHIQLPCTTTGLQAALTVFEAELSQLVVTRPATPTAASAAATGPTTPTASTAPGADRGRVHRHPS